MARAYLKLETGELLAVIRAVKSTIDSMETLGETTGNTYLNLVSALQNLDSSASIFCSNEPKEKTVDEIIDGAMKDYYKEGTKYPTKAKEHKPMRINPEKEISVDSIYFINMLESIDKMFESSKSFQFNDYNDYDDSYIEFKDISKRFKDQFDNANKGKDYIKRDEYLPVKSSDIAAIIKILSKWSRSNFPTSYIASLTESSKQMLKKSITKTDYETIINDLSIGDDWVC